MPISSSQQSQMQNAAEAALSSNQAVQLAAPDIDGIKEFFCEHWGTVKSILQFLANNIGWSWLVKPVVKAIIAAGDALHDSICGQ